MRDADGRMACTQVGARSDARAGDWPDDDDAGSLAGPTRYVRAGADRTSADGTRERPFADPAAALASLPADGGAVVIARGRYVLTSALAPRGEVALVGAGASAEGGTVFEAGAGSMVVGTGSTARVTLRGLLLRHTSAPDDGGALAASILAEGGAMVRAEGVAILQPGIGVLVSGRSRLIARGLTVRRAAGHGVLATDGSACDLRDVLVRDGRGRGIEAQESQLQLHRALVHENAGIGVALRGNTALDPAGGAARCTADGPSVERGALSCISYASITCNGVAGLYTQGQVHVAGLRLVLSGTRRVGAMPGGDGLVVTGGAAFDLDPDVDAMGAGSEVVGNARIGVLVQDGGSVLSMRGALVGSNDAAGLFVASLAVVSRVVASEFAYNTGVGVAVATSTELGELRDSTIRDTRMGTLPGGSVRIGDGLSVGGAAVGAVVNNELSGNPRFAGVFAGAVGALRQNRGSDNAFSLYAYDSPRLTIDATNRVLGLAGSGRPAVTTELPR